MHPSPCPSKWDLFVPHSASSCLPQWWDLTDTWSGAALWGKHQLSPLWFTVRTKSQVSRHLSEPCRKLQMNTFWVLNDFILAEFMLKPYTAQYWHITVLFGKKNNLLHNIITHSDIYEIKLKLDVGQFCPKLFFFFKYCIFLYICLFPFIYCCSQSEA